MERQILVPLDGSALAEAILPHAVLVAGHTGRGLTLLRVVPSPTLIEPVGGALPATGRRIDALAGDIEEARRYLAAVAARLAGTALPIETLVAEGDPAAAILEYATRHTEGLLIAMATHGRTGARRWVFGSVAERVLHAAPAPLLLVRPPDGGLAAPTPTDYYQTILVPLDGSTLAEQALAPARSLAKALDAVLVLVGVAAGREEQKGAAGGPAPGAAPPRDQYLAQIARTLRAEGVPAESLVAYGQPAEGILHESTQIGADLIIMATHGRSGLQQLWLGSVALKVVQGTTLPVLLVRARPVPEGERAPAEQLPIPALHPAAP